MSASETLSRRATATRPAKAVPAWAGRLRAVLPGAAFCALTALLWQAMALARHSPLVPGLGEISGEIVRLLAGGMAIGQVALTLWRIVLGGAASCVIAFALALAAARFPLLRAFIRPAVLLGLTVPGLVWALLCVIWFGIGLATPVVSIILGVTPPLLVTISEGLRNIDPKLMEVARVLRLSRWSRLRDVVLPSLAPLLLSGVRVAFSLAWKVIVLVELFGLSDGVGYQLNSEFSAQNVAGVIAWTIIFWAVMALIELGFIQTLENRLTPWRREVAL